MPSLRGNHANFSYGTAIKRAMEMRQVQQLAWLVSTAGRYNTIDLENIRAQNTRLATCQVRVLNEAREVVGEVKGGVRQRVVEGMVAHPSGEHRRSAALHRRALAVGGARKVRRRRLSP